MAALRDGPMAFPEKRPAEVDDVKNVGKVLSIDLEPYIHTVRLINIRARRGIDLEGGIDAASGKVDTIHDLLSVISVERLCC